MRPSPRPSRSDRPGGRSAPLIGECCCDASPMSWRSTPRGTGPPEVTNAGHTIGNARWRRATSSTSCATTRPLPERLFGRQIPSPVASTSPSRSRSASSRSSCRGTSRCPSPDGASPRHSLAGNTVILKPAELTPLTAIRLGGVGTSGRPPEGVFTILPGGARSWGSASSPTPTSARSVSPARPPSVRASCARPPTRPSGSPRTRRQSANIVFADADVEKAAASAPMSFLDNRQDCCARTRILVQRKVSTPSWSASRRRSGLSGWAIRRRVHRDGPDGEQRPTRHGALLRRDAEATGHAAPTSPSAVRRPRARVVSPTVLAAHGTDDRAWREEIFGPVVSVMPFDDEADAIAKANDTAYGLSGSIWTRDVAGRSACRGRSRPATCR